MIDYGDYIRLRSAMGSPSSTVEGYPCHLIRSSGKHLLNYSVCGNSSQIGVPSPSSPAEITSVGDLVTDETDANYGKYRIPLVVHGKNILSCTSAADTYKYGTVINKDYSITINPGSNSYSTPINVKQSKTYTIPADNITITASCMNANDTVSMVVRTKKYISSSSDYYKITSGSKSFTLSKGDSIQAYIQMTAGTILNEPLTLYPQFELGETATAHVPYITPITKDIYLEEPLRRIGDYSDYIDFKKQAVIRNVKSFHIPSNLTWNTWSATGNGRRVLIHQTSDKLYGENLTTLGYFNCGPVSQKITHSNRSDTLCAYNLSPNCYWFPDYTVMGLDGSETIEAASTALQAWLKSAGDIYFTYVLAKPKEEKVSLPIIPTQKGDIFISTSTSFPASNISAKYSVKP